MSHKLHYDRYFRVVTVAGDKEDTSAGGVEEYNPVDFSDNNVLYLASIYIDDGGRYEAVKQAMETIQTQVDNDDRVVIRLNGRHYMRWRSRYPRYQISQMKAGRGGFCNMLAIDAVKRESTITQRLKEVVK